MVLGIPDPSGSPNEKIEIPDKLWPAYSDLNLEKFLRAEGVDPELSRKIARAFKNASSQQALRAENGLRQLQNWANVHTHPSVGGSEVEFSESLWSTSSGVVLLEPSDGSYNSTRSTVSGFPEQVEADTLGGYVVMDSGVHAYEGDGTLKWSVTSTTNGALSSYLQISSADDGTVLVTVGSPQSLVLIEPDGSVRWQLMAHNAFWVQYCQISPDGAHAVQAMQDGNLAGLAFIDVADGSVIEDQWMPNWTGNRVSGLNATNEYLIAVTTRPRLRLHDWATRGVVWSNSEERGSDALCPLIQGDFLYYVQRGFDGVTGDNRIVEVDLTTGSIVDWSPTSYSDTELPIGSDADGHRGGMRSAGGTLAMLRPAYHSGVTIALGIDLGTLEILWTNSNEAVGLGAPGVLQTV